MLVTTGALLRTAQAPSPVPRTFVALGSCGPCRFALFDAGWRRALAAAGVADIDVLAVDQSWSSLASALGPQALASALEALVVADAFAESVRRLRPRVLDVAALEDRAVVAAIELSARIEAGDAPTAALRGLATWHAWHHAVAMRAPEACPRFVVVGEPWSLHADGEAQLDLARVLGAAGAEVEIPPLSLFVAYRLWALRQPAWSPRAEPSAIDGAERRAAAMLEERLPELHAAACEAAGLSRFPLASIDELAELASPFVSPDVRGGYGHVEVGLAVRARRDRRAHVVVSVKSFGCIPSSGVSDAILPTALGELPFLSLEVCGDGDAARESRLMLRLARATEAAAAELRDALAGRAVDLAGALPHPLEDPFPGRRPFACTLACAAAASSSFATTHTPARDARDAGDAGDAGDRGGLDR